MSQDKKGQDGENAEIHDLKSEVDDLKNEVEELEEELIDLEEWAKASKEPKRAKSYVIRIDKTKYTVHVHQMTGAEILALAGKKPDAYQLSQKFHGGRVEAVKPTDVVIFHKHKIERFQTLALDPTEG